MFVSKKFKNLKRVTNTKKKKMTLHRETTKTGTNEQHQNRQRLELLHFGCKKKISRMFQKTYKSLSTTMHLLCTCTVIPPSLTELKKCLNKALGHMVSFLRLSCAEPRVGL